MLKALRRATRRIGIQGGPPALAGRNHGRVETDPDLLWQIGEGRAGRNEVRGWAVGARHGRGPGHTTQIWHGQSIKRMIGCRDEAARPSRVW